MRPFSDLVLLAVFGFFFAACAAAFFGVLMAFGYYESRTGIERGATPLFAIAGAAVLGFFAPKISKFFGGEEFSKPAAVASWIVFLIVGSLVVWTASGGADLGPTGEGFQRDFRLWQVAAMILGAFLSGLLARRITAICCRRS